MDPFTERMQRARELMADQLGLPVLPDELQLRETMPVLGQPVFDFCRTAEIEPPVSLDVTPDADAEIGWCVSNVKRAVEARGGSVAFGWLTWEVPGLFHEAEFHAVLRDLDGHLVDVTPTRDGEKQVLFSQDARFPASFDFRHRPNNKRLKAYKRADWNERIDERLASMSDAAIRYESTRAQRKNMSLREWLSRRLDPDAFDLAIDRFIELAGRLDTMLEPAETGTVLRKGVRPGELERAAADLIQAKVKLWIMAEGALMRNLAEDSKGFAP
jgi:hypothetical protein